MKVKFFDKYRLYQFSECISEILSVGILLLVLQGCITLKSQPIPTPTPTSSTPPMTFVPHPEGWDQIDLLNIFNDPQAPKLESFSKECDSLFQKLKEKVHIKNELFQGTREMVQALPVQFHWCFYAKLWLLEETLSRDLYLDESQKEVLSTYEFLVPVARTFASDFHDSRYLRWAIHRYQKYSERYFLRTLDLTPEGTLELVRGSDPLNPFRDTKSPLPVLEKYQFMPDVKTAMLPASEVGLEKDILAAQVPDLVPEPTPTPSTISIPNPTPSTETLHSPIPISSSPVQAPPTPVSPLPTSKQGG